MAEAGTSDASAGGQGEQNVVSMVLAESPVAPRARP